MKMHEKIDLWDIDKVKPFSGNAKNHKKADIKLLAEHIKENGWDQPIVVVAETGEIIKGHKRLEAAKILKIKKVPVIAISGLTEIEIEERRIADNKLAESPWDNEKLKASLNKLMENGRNISKLGFSDISKHIRNQPTKPEVEFTEVIGEANNYLVLVFDNDIDWLAAQSHFKLKQARARQWKHNEKTKQIGIGRVIDGGKYLNDIKKTN